jgi:hypothetical protein
VYATGNRASLFNEEDKMTQKLSDQGQTNLALAALTACVVKTLQSNDVIRSQDFENALEEVYRMIRDGGGDTTDALQTLSWTKEFAKQL